MIVINIVHDLSFASSGPKEGYDIVTGRSLYCKVEQPRANTLHVKNPTFYIKHHQNDSNFYQKISWVDIHGTYYIIKQFGN